MSRYHLHALDTAGGVQFQTQESDDEAEVAAVGSALARRGWAVWLYEHDHDGDDDGGRYREVGLFVGSVFLPNARG